MEHTITIRRAIPQDLADISECAREAYAKYIDRIGKKPAPMLADFESQIKLGYITVILIENTLAGYIVFYQQKNHLQIENIAIYPRYTGKGLGRQLLEHAGRVGEKNGQTALELYTNVKMFENLSLYKKLGYQEIDRRIEDGFERVYFRKTLPSKT